MFPNMAEDTSVDVDLNDDDKVNEGLRFHDGSYPSAKEDKKKVQTHTFTNFPHTAASDDDEENILDKTQLLKEEKAPPSFWTFEYYQQFFDVETYQVLNRTLGSMVPRPGRNYLKTHIQPNPDLYGPFWICTTLVFTTAIAGNLANYLQSGGKDYQWRYDFHKVTFAAAAIFSYWWVVPAGLYGFLWWRGHSAGYSFLDLLSVYGYSLAIYIPVSILWVVQVDWLQWILVLVGALLSGGVLTLIFWPVFMDSNKRTAWAVVIVIFLLHASLAVGFKLYFFNGPSHVDTGTSTPAVVTNHSFVPPSHLRSQVKTQKIADVPANLQSHPKSKLFDQVNSNKSPSPKPANQDNTVQPVDNNKQTSKNTDKLVPKTTLDKSQQRTDSKFSETNKKDMLPSPA